MAISETRPSSSASVAAAQLAAGEAPGAVVVVNIRNMAFETPEALAIAPGTAVEFVNLDRAPHTVTSTARNADGNGPLFDLRLRPGERARLTFTASQVGTHLFFCRFHPHMTGKLVVKAETAMRGTDLLEASPTIRSTTSAPTNALAAGLAAPKSRSA